MKTRKIAVCLSGQSRVWDYTKENIMRFYNIDHIGLNPAEVDFFIHTWDINSYRDHTIGTSYYSEFWDEAADTNGIIEYFKPKGWEIESYNQYKINRNNVWNFHLTAWEPMYHSFKKSINLKRNYELENNFEYDLVIKSRFDCMFNPNTPFEAFIPDIMKAYTTTSIHRITNEFNCSNFDEAVFFGESRTMDLLSLTGDLHLINRKKMIEIGDTFNPMPEIYFGPGSLIFKHMVNMHICPDYHPKPFHYFVARRHVVDTGYCPIADWDKVAASCKDWYR